VEILQPSWRGRSTYTRKDSSGKKFTAMVGKNALLYLPIRVLEGSIYRITIELYKESGNGIVYCNIYGNRNFDFPAAKIECNRNGWCTYDADIKTKSFPKTVPMMFRIWRAPDGTGTMLIRKVIVELIEANEKFLEKPVIVSVEKAPAGSGKKRAVRPQGHHTRRRRLSTPPEKIGRAGESIQSIRKRRQRQARKKVEIKPLLPIGKFKPEVGPLVPGEDGIKNSVIISMKNRATFLDRTLLTYAKQTMSREEFELIIVDDDSSEDILSVCKRHSKNHGLRFQYIRVDTSKGAISQKGFTPALTNNIGFKKARGSVFIITGPETLQKEHNMERTWNICHAPKCVYGIVYKSNEQFVDSIKKNPKWHEYKHFKNLMNNYKNDLARPSTGGFWWYYAAARKEYIMTARGVDERFMQGISGEDDDFAARMRFLGLQLLHDFDIIGIHQNHSREDRTSKIHKLRFDRSRWRNLRAHNLALLRECRRVGDPIVNKEINWGAEEAIVDMEIF
jgi:glycosyltransferase involved in cell wall biosynthesis